MWLLGIAVIIVAAAVIINFLEKWLNRRRKNRLQSDQHSAGKGNMHIHDSQAKNRE